MTHTQFNKYQSTKFLMKIIKIREHFTISYFSISFQKIIIFIKHSS